MGEGVPKILLERGDNPENWGGGADIEMGGCHFFYYFTVQLHLLCVCVGGGEGGGGSYVCFIMILQSSELTMMQDPYHLCISDSF